MQPNTITAQEYKWKNYVKNIRKKYSKQYSDPDPATNPKLTEKSRFRVQNNHLNQLELQAIQTLTKRLRNESRVTENKLLPH